MQLVPIAAFAPNPGKIIIFPLMRLMNRDCKQKAGLILSFRCDYLLSTLFDRKIGVRLLNCKACYPQAQDQMRRIKTSRHSICTKLSNA